ncbi:MAG: ABC transporter permease [Candidatus Heimdallarchaeota archaeon]|nr:ABC transporter permease [Candidatus Heimdallarchaeota archaeon]
MSKEGKIVIDDERLEAFEKEKEKRRRAGRIMIFWRRFRRHRMGVFGLFIIIFVTFVGVFAPFLAGPGRLVPFGPRESNVQARFTPPFSYESAKDTAASQEASTLEKTVAAFYANYKLNFINGMSTTALPHYLQLSKIDSIVDETTEEELWSSSLDPADYLNANGSLRLPTSFNGSALIDYRTGGKIAFQINPSKNKLTFVSIFLAVRVDSPESVWGGKFKVYLYEAESDLNSANYLASSSVQSYLVSTGPSISLRLIDFRFSVAGLQITTGSTYTVVLDTEIMDIEFPGINQYVVTRSGPAEMDPLRTTNQNWNALDGWNDQDTATYEGWMAYVAVFYVTNKFHVFGTDALGRDILAATIWGATSSLTVAFLAQGITTLIGIIVGTIAGYYGGFWDNVLMRLTDIILAIPFFFLLLIAITLWEQISLYFMAIIIGVLGWAGIARVVRAQFLSLRELEYTEAARALGVSNVTIMFKHLLPNALAPVIVQTTLGTATVILIEAGLSFLGFGDPLAVSWGTAIQWGMTGNTLRFAPWVATIPGLAIFVVVLGFNLMGDALRDALDPRLKN